MIHFEESFKQNRAIHKYIRVNNEENITYFNYLLPGEGWENVYQQHDIDIVYKESLQTLTYYFDTAIPLRKVNINKQIRNQWITLGICKSSERLKFLSRYIKERNVSTEFINYYNKNKQIYHKIINLAKEMYHDKRISESINKSKQIWDFIKDKSGESEKKKYAQIVINTNGNLISEPTRAATLLNAYFTEIAERLQCNFTHGVLKHSNGNQKLSASIFFTPINNNEMAIIIKVVKNNQVD
jgi:hypothetical protein